LQLLATASEDYSYQDLAFTQTSDVAFTATFTTNIFNREQFVSWKKYFEIQTRTQFTVDNTQKVNGKRRMFSQRLSCLHNVHHGKVGKGKHTACPARMTVQIHSVQTSKRRSRMTRNIKDSYPCLISLTWNHNHPIVAADVLRRQNVRPEIDFKLANLYKNGHTPSTALQFIKTEIENNLKQGDRLDHALDNRSLCPDYQHCWYIFRKVFSKDYGNPNGNERISDFIETLNADMHGESVIYDLPSIAAMETDGEDADLQSELQQVHEIFTDTLKKVILERVESDSSREIIAGYKAANAMLSKITTTNTVSSALRTFGRYSEGSASLTKCHHSGNIPVQNTTVARGHKCFTQGSWPSQEIEYFKL